MATEGKGVTANAPPPYPGFNPQVYPPQTQPMGAAPQGGGVAMPQAYQPVPAATSTTVIQTQPTAVVYVRGGNCPACHMGILNEHYGCCAIFLAIFFFPIGILCCLAMRNMQCSNCGATF